MRPPHFLRALASRNYRLYFASQCVSLLGNWMTSTASLWLVYHLSGSAFDVGLVGFAKMVPVFVLAPFAGVLLDRVDGLRVVRATQALAMLQSGALAAITLSGHMTVPILIALCGAQGLVNAADFPARQTLTYRLTDERAPLDNVIALNSIYFNLARLAGPAVAGFVIAGFGPGACFTVDAISYLPVLAALKAVRLAAQPVRARMAHPLRDLEEGFRYAARHPSIRRLLLMVAVFSLAGFAHGVLAPIFARDVFDGDARTLGFLMSATGVGSLLAALFMSNRSSGGLGRVCAWGAAIGGAGLAGLAVPAGLPFALLCYAGAGFGAVLFMVSANTLVQTAVDDEKRGRVMSLFTTAQGLFPFGSVAIGAVTGWLGLHATVALCGAVCLAAAAIFARGGLPVSHCRTQPIPLGESPPPASR
jgi:MFS family permease